MKVRIMDMEVWNMDRKEGMDRKNFTVRFQTYISGSLFSEFMAIYSKKITLGAPVMKIQGNSAR